MHLVLSIFIITLTIILILAGLAGVFLPILPSAPLILGGSFIYGLYFGFEKVGLTIYILLIVLTIIILFLDYLAWILGAKKFGASRWGITGTILGGIIGLFLGNILGVILGPVLGAFLGEILSGKKLRPSLKAGAGVILGFMIGVLFKFALSVIMIGLFIFSLF